MVRLHPHPGRHLFPAAIVLLSASILVSGVLIALSFYYAGEGAGQVGGSTITITATGSASMPGGGAELYLYVNGTGNTTQSAVANLSRTLSTVNSSLSGYLNGNLSLITTQYFNVGKVTLCVPYPYVALPAWCSGNYNKTSYQAYESVSVDIPNAKNATGVLVALSGIPNVYVSSIQAKLTDQQTAALRGEALASAMSNATVQATALAPSGKVSPLNITVNNYYVYPLPYSFGGTPVAAQAAASSQAVNSLFYSGTSSITESITVVFGTG